MEQISVSSKGQIVIPKNFREDLGIKEGQKVFIEEAGGSIIIVPVSKNPVQTLKGLAKGVFKKSSTRMVRELREEWQ